MSSTRYSIQKKTPFSESLIWKLNQDFYKQVGIRAWTEGIVPHEITNSSLAATTYAELIYASLKDIASHSNIDQKVYILELGAGHGKLCFNILKCLDKLIMENEAQIPKYCYVLSDIVEKNLTFLSDHPQLQNFFDRGVLDISYFNATEYDTLALRKSKSNISVGTLQQPILTIANYFFDSIPNELFCIKNKDVFNCEVSIDSPANPEGKSAQDIIGDMELSYHMSLAPDPSFKKLIYNEIFAQYIGLNKDCYILFPKKALECLSYLASLSRDGLVLLTMDKGYKNIQDYIARPRPDIVRHGSFSLWVNFHALSEYCIKNGGEAMFDNATNLSVELACLFFTKSIGQYQNLEKMYRKHTSQLNLDDLNSIKKMLYKNIASVDLSEILGLVRLSSFDSTIFVQLLPSIKRLSTKISVKERSRLKQTINQVWLNHYRINQDYDLSYELGGLLYDLAYYDDALDLFNCSADLFGEKADINYNQILCYYQLRQDKLFYKALDEAKLRFPNSKIFGSLEKLDMA